MSKSKLREIIDAVLAITKSNQKMHNAIIGDLVNLEERISKLENYFQIVEARREAELTKGKNEIQS
jgi:hypothetical protein